ncbi:Hypothetical protein CAP_2574 [Chondromyces apiculatus DSM 436]|uniref:Uncharacterized protein n=1 Tax=Chondromyces apiculatus DSM 436 TaxID=1192034 RepID=A0A017THG2_9BACT|nr:Hypothetical protein CAP_2574 [Chondromyces apiculatus DSM 436]
MGRAGRAAWAGKDSILQVMTSKPCRSLVRREAIWARRSQWNLAAFSIQKRAFLGERDMLMRITGHCTSRAVYPRA